MAAPITYLADVASPAVAEAMAMRDGFSLVVRLGCNNVVTESDSLEVVQACMGEKY